MVATVTTYMVQAVRSNGWWGLTVPAVPGVVSQVRSLAQAEAYAREAIAWVTGVGPDSFEIRVVPELPAELAEQVQHARGASAEAEASVAAAATLSRAVVAALAEAGFNGRETAVILGLSKQRVSQLAGSGRRPLSAESRTTASAS